MISIPEFRFASSPQFWDMSASVSLEDPTINILKYAFNELIQLPGFEIYGQGKDSNGRDIVPIYPVTNAGTQLPEISGVEDGLVIIYDDFIKARSGKNKYFYPIKGVQSRFKVVSTDYAVTRAVVNRMVEIIDREDAAAEDVNSFMKEYYAGNHRIVMHCINAYQTTYMKDATNLDDQRNVFSQDIIIKADYHLKPLSDNLR